MDFKYVAYTEDKKMAGGILSAASEKAARQLLADREYRVLILKPVQAFMPRWEKWFPSLFQIKPGEIILFSRQLALLLESGTDIVASLEILQTQVSTRFKRILSAVVFDLRSGQSLSVALAKYPDIFPSIYRRTVSVGERTGSMEIVLRQTAEYMEKEVVARKKVKGAMGYPLFVSIVAIIVTAILIIFVLPSFTTLYSSLGANLPLPTRLLLSFTQAFSRYGPYLLIALVSLGVLVFAYTRTPSGKYRWDGLMLRLPLLGKVNLINELARCCQSMALLFRAGLPLTEIMTLVIENCGNKVLKGAFCEVQESMLRGEGLSKPMGRNPLFPPLMTQMTKVGEETGSLDTSLSTIAQNYETEADEKTRSLIGMIQPTLSLVIGLVVAFIVISMMSAMYSVYGQMG